MVIASGFNCTRYQTINLHLYHLKLITTTTTTIIIIIMLLLLLLLLLLLQLQLLLILILPCCVAKSDFGKSTSVVQKVEQKTLLTHFCVLELHVSTAKKTAQDAGPAFPYRVCSHYGTLIYSEVPGNVSGSVEWFIHSSIPETYACGSKLLGTWPNRNQPY